MKEVWQVADCEKWQEMISAYADGECTAEEAEAVGAHLQECPACREWYEQITRDQEVFRTALTGRQADISDTVMRRVNEMSAEKSTKKPQEKSATRKRLVELLLVVGILAILAAVLFPVFARSRDKARQSSCLSNTKQATLATLSYAEDYDGRLPDAITWDQAIEPYLGNRQIPKCNMDKSDQAASYAMVQRWGGVKLEDIPDRAETILIYEVEHGRPAYRHNEGMNVGYADGHAKWLRELPPDALDPGDTTGMMPGTAGRNYGLARRLKLAYDAACEVWVEHLQGSVLAAEEVFPKCGGFVLRSTMTRSHDCSGAGRADVVGKVPTARVADAVNALAALGYVARRDIIGTDMTDQYVAGARDITRTKQKVAQHQQRATKATRKQDRERAQQAVEKAREALGPAQDSLFGVSRELALATITATLIEKQPEVSEAASGIAAAWMSFQRSAKVLAVLVTWALLYGLFAVPVIAAAIIYRRRR